MTTDTKQLQITKHILGETGSYIVATLKRSAQTPTIEAIRGTVAIGAIFDIKRALRSSYHGAFILLTGPSVSLGRGSFNCLTVGCGPGH